MGTARVSGCRLDATMRINVLTILRCPPETGRVLLGATAVHDSQLTHRGARNARVSGMVIVRSIPPADVVVDVNTSVDVERDREPNACIDSRLSWCGALLAGYLRGLPLGV